MAIFLEAYRVNNSMEDSHWHLRYRSQVLEIWLQTVFEQSKLHLWSVKDKMDVLHELLQIKDIVEGPAKDGAGEGESHGVEGAVQDDPVHPVALGLADRRGVRGDPRSHGVAVDDQPGDGREEVGVCWCVCASVCVCVFVSVYL